MITSIKESGGDPRKELVTGKENETFKLKRRKLNEIAFSEQKVVIDVSFDEAMTDKEVRSLVSQLTQLYAKNRLVEHPLQIFVTDFSGRFKQNLDSLDGFENWQGVKCEEKSYLDLFPKERLVYLTADSDDSIQALDENDIYIIGGIVDKNRYKGICLKKAQEQGIRTARLPIDSFMDLKTRKVLTVNQVYEILLNWTVERDWAKAFDAIIPKRKGGSVLHPQSTNSPSSPSTPKTDEDSSQNGASHAPDAQNMSTKEKTESVPH